MGESRRLSVHPMSDWDRHQYERLLPEKSLLRDAARLIPWERLRSRLQKYYSSSSAGQPEYDPVLLLKLEFLCYLSCMGRQSVIDRGRTDLEWKFFLELPIFAGLPDQSTLCVFRKRLGVEGFTEIFNELIAFAREQGVVGDQLRLKDATHIYADIAVPSALGLFAQLRNKMLSAIKQFDPGAAEAYQSACAEMQERTQGENADVRLQARVEMVQDLLAWIRQQPAPVDLSPKNATCLKHWQSMQATADLADKILADLANPEGGDKVISVVDPDARRGKHGQYYDGYLLDIMMDADSELVTALNVLPANGDEARDTIELIQAEEAAHGNDVEQVSVDGIGFNGEVLRELTAEDGVNVQVFTPPRAFTTNEGFESSQFELVEGGMRVRCPAGELSGRGGTKAGKPNTMFYTFPRKTCAACPLLAQCCPHFNPQGRGRRVSKNEYEKEYQKAREVAQSSSYAEVRRKHSAIERKLNEFVRHHDGRRARHRMRWRCIIQHIVIGTVINLKRIIKLLRAKCAPTQLAEAG